MVAVLGRRVLWSARRPARRSLAKAAQEGTFTPPPVVRPIKKLLCANRGEIAIRVFRAASELNIRTVAVFSYEDRIHSHRYKADEGYLIGKGLSPVGAYLNYEEVIKVALRTGVDAIHPGYGFLSERADFAKACADNDIIFVGPNPGAIEIFGDKTQARNLARRVGVPIIEGTDGAVKTAEEAKAFVQRIGCPVILKASKGGGGRGMRVVRNIEEIEESFERASSEALQAFGDGSMFIEKYIDRPRHIEVQILGDHQGQVVHFFERDCSVQRRHQKVVEVAPAINLDPNTRQQLFEDAINITKSVGYYNAGTVEFLVDREGKHYFIEVNPRIQVEHTISEEITRRDLVQSQIRIASGTSLEEMGLTQDKITARGCAIQCRVTTENPKANFQPDNGIISVFRAGEGMGIRLDSGSGFAGAVVSPHYDSLLCKVTGTALTFPEAASKLQRSLSEFRVRGVSTNIQFLKRVLAHPRFLEGDIDTFFVDNTKELFEFPSNAQKNRGEKMLAYLADVLINGPSTPWMTQTKPARVEAPVPAVSSSDPIPDGWMSVLNKDGPTGLAKAVRQHKGLLVTDTTWRDAHQSLLATRMRTYDLNRIADATARYMPQAFSIENWGGATFDVSMRFLRECPWDRLALMREKVPNIPFQMLLRGANGVGYTSYPDNAVYEFCKLAVNHGMNVFRVFDSLNYVDNLKLGMDAVGTAGGVVEAAICYTGNLGDPAEDKYTLEYYLNLAREIMATGSVHILAIKDMANLLTPKSARILVSALRQEFPDVPIHVHTHDTAGNGVAAMLAAAQAGADIVDAAIDSMSGTTSQPSLGSIVTSTQFTDLDTGLDSRKLQELHDFWEITRTNYAPFECGPKSGSSDVFEHEIPGGQFTNLLFQTMSLGLADQWPEIKRKYAAANRLMGDIIKVTPSSKSCGDLAQFMVQNNLSEEDVLSRADALSFPSSVVDYFRGSLGIPYGGFPQDLQKGILKGETPISGRPGASLPPIDFEKVKQELEKKHGEGKIRDVDVMSSVMYPAVFDDFVKFRDQYGDLSVLPTPVFFDSLRLGEEVHVDLEPGKTLVIKLTAVGEMDKKGLREIHVELNGQPRTVRVYDKAATVEKVVREKADTSVPGQIGAPMNGVVVEIRAAVGDKVSAGAPLVVLSAAKMEVAVTAPVGGVVERLPVAVGDDIKAGDLTCVIKE